MRQHKFAFQQPFHMNPEYMEQKRRGRVAGGIIMVLVGAAFLARALGVILPAWLFTWPVILLLVSLHLLIKHGPQRPGWLITGAIGGAFLAEHLFTNVHIHHIIWPAVIIAAGLMMIFAPWGKWRRKKQEYWTSHHEVETDKSSAEYIDVNAVFGGVEKTIISKNFQGGQINCVFGGAEINLTQADIQGTVTLEINSVFGGAEISVPSNWKVETQVTAVLGGVQDKRAIYPDAIDHHKTLILKGSAVFGGIEIKGF